LDIEKYISQKRNLIDKEISTWLDREGDHPLSQILRYSLSGGKRFRPILVISAAEACGCDGIFAMPAAMAVEMIHNFSLIHDDLPCMDNDDFRRGMETCHKKFGETEALLAGDALLICAFNILSGKTKGDFVSVESILKVIELYSRASGHFGMTGGQVLDMRNQGKTEIGSATLIRIHRHKTGALITASVMAGGIIAGASGEKIDRLKTYGEKIGLTYQIIDDILDMEADQGAISFPAVFGLDESRKMAEAATGEAINALDIFGDRAEPLRELAGYLLIRKS